MANPQRTCGEARCVFNVTGKQPELWDAVTGEMRDLPDFKDADGQTTLTLNFAPAQSFFVVFRKPGKPSSGTSFPALTQVAEITGPWNVSFDPKWGGPAMVKFDKLEDWTKRPEPGIMYYSGTAIYRTMLLLHHLELFLQRLAAGTVRPSRPGYNPIQMIGENPRSTEAPALATLAGVNPSGRTCLREVFAQRKMQPVQTLGLLLLLPVALQGADRPVEPDAQIHALSMSDLKQRLVSVDETLNQLASLSLLSGVGSVGYRSQAHTSPSDSEWIQIDLGGEVTIDQIVLIPAIWRDTKTGFRADGFPLQFRILTGTTRDAVGTVVATFGSQDRLLPRIAPLVVACSGTVASWVRVETVVMSPRAWDGKYIFQLSEILVFSGEENLALRRPVRTSSPDSLESPAWNKRFLVDGFLPYLMDAAEGGQSVAFLSKIGIGEHPCLTIDLAESLPLDRIHYHATDLSDTVPQAIPDAFGVPRRMVMEGANHPDFSDAVPLVELHLESVYDTGPMIMQRFPVTSCRYVRLTAVDPFINTIGEKKGSLIGAAEIELFSKGRNVTLGKEMRGSFTVNTPERSFAALTDGRNLYGKILPVRDWMQQLARRHDLETERPVIATELDHRYARQKTNLNRMGWLAVLLGAGIVSTILIDRIIRMRQVSRIRERLAADLHDELGANLHTIGLLSDLAANAGDSPAEMDTLHRRIRSETERSGTAVRHCSDMLSAKGLYTDLLTDMQRTSNRIMAKLEHEIAIEGEEYLKALKPRTRADLFLFYKECLVNISRHSGATKYTTLLHATADRIHLRICDNGRGLETLRKNVAPSSLKRRAKLMDAKVTVENPPTGGTCIELNLRTRKWGFHK